MITCPSREALARWLEEHAAGTTERTADTHPAVVAHLQVCERCQGVLASLTDSLGGFLPLLTSSWAAGGPEPTAADEPVDVPGYVVGERIGQGGMGVVYLARNLALDRHVAIKVLHPAWQARPAVRERFMEEARIASRLQHPGVPPVHELGTLPDGRPYFVMKVVRGQTLAALLAARPHPGEDLPRYLGMFEQVCQALAYAHSNGVIHRDLKPANVMVGAFGEVQVMDWGLAKVLTDAPATGGDRAADPADAAVGAGRAPMPDARTRVGTTLGTPAYMPPEQARGEPDRVGRRSDVFGLGAVLCEILTGQPPFAGGNVLRLAQDGILAPARDRLAACGGPPELIALAGSCLACRPEDRPPDAAAVAGEVAAYQAAAEGRLRRAERDRAAAEAEAREQHKRRRVQLALAGVVVLVAAGAGIATNLVLNQRIAAEQKRQDDLRLTRADALVQALATAETAEVPRLIDDLREFRDLTGPRLRELAGQPIVTKPGLHARLALADEPTRAAELAAYLPTCHSEELLTVVQLLKPHAATVAPALWVVLTDAKEEARKRVRAAGALAGLTPDDARWGAVAPAVADAVVRANPVEFVVWAQALEAVRGPLLPALVKRYPESRDQIEKGKLGVSELAAEAAGFDLTADLLARYIADRPTELAELALTADPRHYKLFAVALKANKDAVVRVLKAELAKAGAADWEDSPLKPEWAAVDPSTVRTVEAANGLVHERFALVQSLLLTEFEGLANALGRSGYRPARVRPYLSDAGAKVAVVWRRDGAAWKFLAGATAKDVRAKDDELRAAGFQPADVAAWVDRDAESRPSAPFVALVGGRAGSRRRTARSCDSWWCGKPRRAESRCRGCPWGPKGRPIAAKGSPQARWRSCGREPFRRWGFPAWGRGTAGCGVTRRKPRTSPSG